MSWALRYLLEPIAWTAGGDDALACDCWGFVRRVQRETFGRDLPRLVVAEGPAFVARALAGFAGRADWRKRLAGEAAADGDIVLLDSGAGDDHVGVWCAADRGGVLHCSATTGGVLFTPAPLLELHGYPRHRIWTYDPAR